MDGTKKKRVTVAINAYVSDLYINDHLRPNELIYILGESDSLRRGVQLCNNTNYFILKTQNQVTFPYVSMNNMFEYLQVNETQLSTRACLFRIVHPEILTKASLQSISNKLNSLGLKILICDSPYQRSNSIIQVIWLFTFPPCDQRNYNICQLLWGMIPDKHGVMKNRAIINSRYQFTVGGEIIIPSYAAKHKLVNLDFGGPTVQLLLNTQILTSSMYLYQEHFKNSKNASVFQLIKEMSEYHLGRFNTKMVH